jgi:hydrogenase nickel incorporation protein HypA/HybF
MHELSIALGIVDIAEEESGRRGSVAILAVHVKLGPLSGVVKEALSSAYELAREDSLLADAPLVIEETPLVIRCPRCEIEATVPSVYELCCPRCGTPSADIIAGRELEVTALEIAQ